MNQKQIGIVYNEPFPLGRAFFEASRDILTQVDAVEKALLQLGHTPVCIQFRRKLDDFLRRLSDHKIRFVFNFCETVDEDLRLAGHPAAVLELLGTPFSGSPSAALTLTTDKLMTKRLLRACGIKTPNYLIYDGASSFNPVSLRFPVIIKPRYEDASIGIDQESIFADEGGLQEGVRLFFKRFGPFLIEEYIEGREYNVSVYGFPKPRVLPIAEIDFSQLPQGHYPIVGYRAKWDRASFEFHHTPRVFPDDIPDLERAKIESTALKCFDLFMLRDYGRVDVRVDQRRGIYVLEINANPCLSPDAGFVAALEAVGIGYATMVDEMVHFMDMRCGKDGYQALRSA
jgi:D-alanine-D-alanine ligase